MRRVVWRFTVGPVHSEWRKRPLAEFEGTLKKEPNRFAAYVSAVRAAGSAGDAAKAQQYAANVMALTENADTNRPEVRELRTLTTAAAALTAIA